LSTEIGELVFSHIGMTKPAIPSSLKMGSASEPGPVKAERCDRREQARRREALTGGSDATQWVTREWQAARGDALSSRRLCLCPIVHPPGSPCFHSHFL
jgi:hypothetical protein